MRSEDRNGTLDRSPRRHRARGRAPGTAPACHSFPLTWDHLARRGGSAGPGACNLVVCRGHFVHHARGRVRVLFDFDTLPADLINGADVFKTSAASQNDGGIGGLMNLHTARPLDLKHFTAIASVKGEKDDISGSHAEPQGFLLLSDTFADGTFGALGSLSLQERSAPTNRAFTGNWFQTDFPLLPVPPAGATARCKDRTWSVATDRSSACSRRDP